MSIRGGYVCFTWTFTGLQASMNWTPCPGGKLFSGAAQRQSNGLTGLDGSCPAGQPHHITAAKTPAAHRAFPASLDRFMTVDLSIKWGTILPTRYRFFASLSNPAATP